MVTVVGVWTCHAALDAGGRVLHAPACTVRVVGAGGRQWRGLSGRPGHAVSRLSQPQTLVHRQPGCVLFVKACLLSDCREGDDDCDHPSSELDRALTESVSIRTYFLCFRVPLCIFECVVASDVSSVRHGVAGHVVRCCRPGSHAELRRVPGGGVARPRASGLLLLPTATLHIRVNSERARRASQTPAVKRVRVNTTCAVQA
jgi:hypothetical protein